MTSRSTARAGQPRPGPFADLLLRHRLTAGLSQRELADRSGLSERAVRDLERGTTTQPRWRSVQTVAAALGLQGDELTRFLATARAGRDPGGAAVLTTRQIQPASTGDDLVGRARELRQLADLVTGGRYRMVTVTGAGGVGKSRIVAELVAVLRRHDGIDVRTLDLAGLTDPQLVGEAIAETLDTGGGSRLPPVERAAAALRTGRVLLVLDRFEHVLPAAPLVAALVRRCVGLHVVVTSQRPLRISGERQFPLEPLPVEAAVELFVRRAAAITPGFVLTADDTEAVTAVCRAVEGLPLAVELAAARTRLMTPTELAARFDRQLRLLTGGAADLPARHQSLRATIESSLDVVTEDGRTLFAWLGAFAGGCRLADLEAIAASLGRDEDWLLAALGELVDTSLVRVRRPAEASRYVMPDAMAELAGEHLVARADRAEIERAAAVRFLGRVREFGRQPLREDRRDAGNVRTAAQFAIAHDIGLLEPATIAALQLYYERTGRPDEGKRLLVAIADSGAPAAYLHAGKFARLQGDLPEAARLGHLAMDALDPADSAGLAEIRLHLGAVATEAGDDRVARLHMRAALASARRSKDLHMIGRALNHLGALSAETGQLADAERLSTAALEARRRNGAAEPETAATLLNLAEIALEMGRYEPALARAEQAAPWLSDRLSAHAATIRALALLGLSRPAAARQAVRPAEEWLARGHEERRQAALIGLRCSVVLAATGEQVAAANRLRAALPGMLDSTQRYHDEAATALEAHAGLLADRDAVTAAQLLGAADRVRRPSRRPVSAATASTLELALRRCREALGNSRFNREHRVGGRLGITALIDLCGRIIG